MRTVDQRSRPCVAEARALHGSWPSVLGLACALLVAVPAGAVAQPPSAGLFVAARETSEQASSGVTFAIRSQRVRVDLARLRAETAFGPGSPLVLNLFDDATFTAVLDRVDVTATGFVWAGHLLDVPLSTVTLATEGGVLYGTVLSTIGTYEIRHVANGVHVISQIDQGALPPEAPPLIPGNVDAAAAPDGLDLGTRDQFDMGSTIDVMVLYTPAAEAAAGGAASMTALISNSVSQTNTSYADSQVTQRLRLVHSARVEYTESGDINTDLDSITNGSGAFSGVPALRNAYSADIVTLLTNTPSSQYCGIAWLMANVSSGFASSAYNVVEQSCASAGLTYAHELGHNMGARHDWYVDSGITPYTYAHGYVDVANRWRTIMSYNDVCSDQGFSCSRIARWSNPGLTWSGAPTGVAGGTNTSCTTGNSSNPPCDADDHRTLDNTAPTVANFRSVVFRKLQPANTSVVATRTLTLSWETAAGATEYSVCIDTTNDSSCDGNNWSSAGTSTSRSLSGLSDTTYYWQVRALVGTTQTPADQGTWWSFTVDATGPALVVTSPANGQTVATTPYPVTGTASDSGRGNSGVVSVTLAGVRASNDTAGGSAAATWSASVALTPGTNSIPIVATDGVGNQATQTLTVNYVPPDTTGPALVVTSPTNGQTVATTPYPVTGTASDGGRGNNGVVSVTLAGARASNDTASGSATATWSASVALTPGTNSIPIVATDGAGNQTSQTLTLVYAAAPTSAATNAGDYDGDGTADPTAFRPSIGVWYELRSLTGSGHATMWGLSGDVLVPGDYDGDRKTDEAVYRSSSGTWFVLRSTSGTGAGMSWGLAGDTPVPADYDGDGKTDIAVFRPSTGVWFIIRSSTNSTVGIPWGLSGDRPVPADYDGDGKADPTVFRPSSGAWYQLRSKTGAGYGVVWGVNGDVPLAGDYDGDGRADPTVFRASTGTWYELRSTTGAGFGVLWGTNGDVPIVGDYDGDAKADPTVFRPSTSTWYQLRSATGTGYGVVWGAPGDLPQ